MAQVCVAEHGVEHVLAVLGVALGPPFLQAVEVGGPEVPAPRPLAEVSRERRDVPDLRRGGAFAGVGEGGSSARSPSATWVSVTSAPIVTLTQASAMVVVAREAPEVDDAIGGGVAFLQAVEKSVPAPLDSAETPAFLASASAAAASSHVAG